jgi:LemA protein
MTVFWIVVAVAAVVTVMGAVAFSGLARRRKRMNAAWVDIDSELRHRHELVASLINTVLAVAAPKGDLLRPVSQARREAVIAGATGDPARISAAENMLNDCLHSLFEQTQDYPMLAAASTFTATRDELSASAVRLLPLCDRFNAATEGYDKAIRRFPRSLIARAYGFGRISQYRVDEADRRVPAQTVAADSLSAESLTAEPLATR